MLLKRRTIELNGEIIRKNLKHGVKVKQDIQLLMLA